MCAVSHSSGARSSEVRSAEPHLDVEGRAHHLAILYELGNNRAHDVNGDGKTDPSGGACVGEDGGVDPNHPALSHKPWSVSVKPPSSAAQEKKSKDYTFQRQ